ncbi:hypothetical protein GKQ23_10765 [Erwinia sp. E602]|uniref:hypothetical protein n=1 Tax=Erwinia sp. E602 TaxID=2675378 RepID=UPI001BA9D0D6|nr:hypothetical protein [Erwinia sp. E602]QUG75437.1 hypothetical protein GKQ23_10765 [Erwinia sp. E602]
MSEKYYVAGCVDNGLDVDQVEDQDAEFWTLYARDVNGESEALADFADRRSAEAAMAVYVERDVLGEQVRALAAEKENARDVMLYAANNIAYAIFNLSDKKLSDLKRGLSDTTCPTDSALLAERELRSFAARIRAGEQS